ncbi:MAG: acetone carboxylase subunit gamma [Parvibaculum sp.]|uniref:acetone carboxylase subunit gamma n=1 Tax=Parvibaculum sp. TaxID=2024848 RepID=UPI0025EAA668|nr:acetone carboxylase subunit gamma [Parvibaculum sp.]MCE9650270.1 acetone carboxylase subunit gamma [Parvibaculum sp.]
MKVFITAALNVDLDKERWECSTCGHDLGSARANYKEGMLVRERSPDEIHAPILDASKYEFTFAPDGDWCAILEYCCPNCGKLAEVEYLPPGHPPAHDIELDIDALKAQWAKREPLAAPVLGPDFTPPPHSH